MDPSRASQVKHLFEVEHLSRRQIAQMLHMCHKTVARILEGKERKRPHPPSSELDPFARLIEEWYRRYPSLQAAQIKERLASYGYQGSYRNLCRLHGEVPEEETAGLPRDRVPARRGRTGRLDGGEPSLRQGPRLRLHPRLVEVPLREVLSPLVHGVLPGRPHQCLQGDRAAQPGRTGTTTFAAWSSQESRSSLSTRSLSTTVAHGHLHPCLQPGQGKRERDAWKEP